MPALVVWAVLVVGAFAYLSQYAATPGSGDVGRERWPENSVIARDSTKPTLLMFLHPACPCSGASVEEFSRMLARLDQRVAAHVVFVRPTGFAPGAEQTGLWRSAAALPGVDTRVDPSGIEARRFGAATSGCTLLYDRQGRLVFRGGITGARGHEGDNPGKSAVLDWFEGARARPDTTPVFGCALFEHAAAEGSQCNP